MNTTRLTDTRLLVLSIVLSGGIFAVDLSLPLGVASGVPYVVIVLASLWSPKRRDTYLAASTGTALTALGYFFSAAGGIFWMVLVNRFLALFVIWAAALLVLQRKSAEAALRKSEKRYRNLFHQAPISLWEEDFSALQQWIAELRKTGVSDLGEYLQHHPEAVQEAARLVRVIDVNEGTLRLFGVGSMAELFSAPLKDVGEHKGSAFSNQAFAEQLIAIWEGRRRFETEFAASTSGGAHIDCLLQWVAPRTPGNLDLSYVIIALSDITDRKRAEAALRESELWMHNIFNSLEESVFVITADRHLVNVNAAAERTFGYSKDELADNSTEILHVDHDHYVEFGKRIQRAFDRSETACLEFELKRKNGEVFPTEHTVSLLKDDAGKAIGIVSVVSDITERKRAEEELRLSAKIADHMAEGINLIRVDDGTLVYTNERFDTIFGYGRGELIGQHFTVLNALGDKRPEETAAEIIKGVQTEGSWSGEVLNVKKDGTEFWCRVHVSTFEHSKYGSVWLTVQEDISDRKRAERARDHERSLLHALMDHMPDNIYFKDTQSRFTRINQAMAEYFGLDSPAEAIGKNDGDFFGEEHARRTSEDEQRVMRSGQSLVAKEEREVWPDGRTTWVSTTKVPLRSDDGRTIGTFGISRDITAGKQAEEALRESELRFRQLAENIDHVFWLTDWVNRTLLYVSPAYETVFRRSCRSLYKDRHSWIENIHPDDKARVAESFARGAEAGVYVEEEYQIVHDDGSTTWIRDRAFPIRNGESAVSRIVGLAEDITGRRSAEEALRESELRFRQLTDHLAEASWLTDWTTREILYVSPAYEHIWGRTCASLRASPRSWADSIHADDRARVVEAFERDAARGLYDVEYRIARPDGETRWIHDRAFPIRDSSETVYRMAGISEDITMRKRADEALKEMNMALANAMPGIARLDLGGRYVEVNEIYAGMVGYRSDELIGSDWKQTVHPEDHAVALQAYERMLLEGKGEFEARGVRKDATTFFKHVLMVKMTDKQGAPTGHHCFMRDITERRQAEGALRESERRLRSVLDGLFEVPVGLCFLDRELRYVFINEWLAKLNGTSVEGHLGRTMREVLPDLAAGAESQLRHVLEGGEPIVEGTVEAETPADPGRKHVFQHTYHPVVASDGAVVGVSCAVQDITKRERVEEALRLSDRRYRELIDALPHGIEECDLNGTITFSSPGNDRLKGYDLGEVVGQKIWDCSASEKAARELQRRVRRLVSDQSAPTTPWIGQITLRDGCLLDVQVAWNRKHADDGRLTGFVSVITDITARRRAEAERTRLVTAIDELVEAVVITDPDGTIEDVNPAFERMTGYPPSEAIGQNMRILKSGKHDRAFYKELWDTIKRGQVWTGTFINKKKDGTLYEEEESISPVRDEHGKITNFVAVKYDVTERKLAAEQIRKHQDELAHLSRLSTMGEMATELAHELNQPLASIVNYTSGCVKRIKAGRPDLQELVAVLNDASSEAQRAGEIIKRIRRFVQKREPARTAIDIAELIRQVLDLMRHDLQKQGIQMRLEVEEHMPTLQGDRIQLQQVLINLLRNSIEAMNETEMKHRRLTVGATTDNHDCMTIFVHDTGCGLGEVDPDSVFEAFYTTREDGTGMGLAISRTIIEAHGGHLDVTNNADGGCTFHFSLPRRWEA